jgi:hypothetical protein
MSRQGGGWDWTYGSGKKKWVAILNGDDDDDGDR